MISLWISPCYAGADSLRVWTGMVGEQLGNYKVLEPIGTGGMASVYVGQHVVLGNRVAIKVLHARHLENPNIEGRFFNEAKAIAAIRHPSVVEIYDFGRGGPTDAAYIVMELLDGENLRARIRRGTIPERDAAIFTRQVAQGLSSAHARGIIHRDLKPDNVFLVPDPEVELGERAKVLDFGIAKHTGMEAPANEHTAVGILVGTPAYMSPEQCRGNSPIDTRADIYSLGVVLYRMVTNQLPFEAGGTGEVLGKHMYIEPPPPIEINEELSASMNATVMRCLQKDPNDRFQSMNELAEALWRVAASGQVPEIRQTGEYNASVTSSHPRLQTQSTEISGRPPEMEYDVLTPGPTPIPPIPPISSLGPVYRRAGSTLGDATGQVSTQSLVSAGIVPRWKKAGAIGFGATLLMLLLWVGTQAGSDTEARSASGSSEGVSKTESPSQKAKAPNSAIAIPKDPVASPVLRTGSQTDGTYIEAKRKPVDAQDGKASGDSAKSSKQLGSDSLAVDKNGDDSGSSSASKTKSKKKRRDRKSSRKRERKAPKSKEVFRTPEIKF